MRLNLLRGVQWLFVGMVSLGVYFSSANRVHAQDVVGDITGIAGDSVQTVTMSTEEIMRLSYDELIELNFQDLMNLAEQAGLSVDDLIELALSRQASIASQREESTSEAPLAAYVISSEDIRNSGYTHIAELFQLIPGAIVRQKTHGNFDVTFRGMDMIPPQNPAVVTENSVLLLMIDNRIVYDQFSGGVLWETLPISVTDVDRIEVVVGAASAMYGPNAITGVINIHTKSGSPIATTSGQASAGLHGKTDAMLNIGFPLSERVSTRWSGFMEHAQRFEDSYFSYALAEDVAPDHLRTYHLDPLFLGECSASCRELAGLRYGGSADLTYTRGEDLDIRFTGGAQQSKAQTLAYNNFVTPLNLRTSTSAFGNLDVRYAQFHFQASYSQGTLDLDEGKRTPYNTRFRTSTLDAKIGGEFDLGYGFALRPEFAVRRSVSEDSPDRVGWDPLRSAGEGGYAPAFMDGVQALTNSSGSLRMEYQPLTGLRFVAALRYDLYSEIQQDAVSWQLVSAWAISPSHHLRLNYSRASRALFHTSLFANIHQLPLMTKRYQIWDQGITQPVNGPLVLDAPMQYLTLEGNTKLKAPSLDLYELGYRAGFRKWIQLDFTLFFQEMRHFDSPNIQRIDVSHVGVDPTAATVSTGEYQHLVDMRRYENLDLRVQQLGGTLALSSQPHDMITLAGHLTMQRTWLRDYEVQERVEYTFDGEQVEYLFATVDRVHKFTPMLFGGFRVNVSPLPTRDLNLGANLSWRSNQVYTFAKLVRDSKPYLTTAIPSTLWLDVSVSYKVLPGMTVFVNVQHLGHRGVQFPFGDRIPTTGYCGIRLDF